MVGSSVGFSGWFGHVIRDSAVTMVQNGVYTVPEGKRIARLADERGAEDREVRRRWGRLLWLGRLDDLILVAVLWLVVFKPGGPAN